MTRSIATVTKRLARRDVAAKLVLTCVGVTFVVFGLVAVADVIELMHDSPCEDYLIHEPQGARWIGRAALAAICFWITAACFILGVFGLRLGKRPLLFGIAARPAIWIAIVVLTALLRDDICSS